MLGSRSWIATVLTLTLTLTATISQAEPSNFRVGGGLFLADTDPAPTYMPSHKQPGVNLFAEMPQSDHTASRFILYHVNRDGRHIRGFETQLMWGIGLSQPGFRVYTGPAWHWEKIRVERSSTANTSHPHHQTFNGWGWQLGFGYQYHAVTLDIAATLRDPHDYDDENKRAGLKEKKPTSYISNLLLSYRF